MSYYMYYCIIIISGSSNSILFRDVNAIFLPLAITLIVLIRLESVWWKIKELFYGEESFL